MLDVLELSRLQFAFTMSFHIIFPSFSIGIASFLVVMEGLWLTTKNKIYYQIIRFWNKIFAITFGMGVVSGIVMEFQLGTNWAGFATKVGSILGPLFIYEVLTAFFIEAGFIGIMIFGWNRVGPKLHYLATVLVMVGTTISAYWIMSANSWMQHPVGYQLINSQLIATNWWAIIFNPYTLPRFIHMIFAAYLATSFVIISISSFYLLRNKFTDFAKKCLSSALVVVMIIIPLQIAVGDLSGTKVFENQPIKTAAIEGVWETQTAAPLLLIAIPSYQQQKNLFSLGIPYLASLINTHHLNGKINGLKTVKPADQPLVWLVFYSFRIMVGIGLAMLLYAMVGVILLYKKQLFSSRKMLIIGQLMAPAGFIAILTGWFTAEIGREPWAVYGVLKIQDAVSQVSMHNVMISFGLIILVYGLIFGYVYLYFLNKTIKHGPSSLDSLQPFSYMGGERALSQEIKK